MLTHNATGRDASNIQGPRPDTLGMIERIPFQPAPDAGLRRAAFVEKFNVRVLGNTEVSLTIPKGVSRLDLVKEAEQIAVASDLFRHVAQPAQIDAWSKCSEFTKPVESDTKIAVDCMVLGSEEMTYQRQKEFLEPIGGMAKLEDLAVAHIALSLATEWRDAFRNSDRSYTVRAEGGQLFCSLTGLTVPTFFSDPGQAHKAIRAAAYVKSF